jgi:hypothetical protein
MKGLLRDELSGAQSVKETLFKTAERRAVTTCFGDAFRAREAIPG